MNVLLRIILYSVCFSPFWSFSQNLIEGEYFYNTDPGQGNGISFALPNNVDVTQTLNLSTVGLSLGFNQVGIRVKRDDGRWSHYWQQMIYVVDPSLATLSFPNLLEGEYFFGADPGQGNGTSFIFPDGADITHNFNVSTVGLNPGFHQLGVRVKRDDGRWSHYWQQPVYISDPNVASVTFPNLIEGEYFFGPDPGQGNGTSFIFPDGADITNNFNISTVGLNPGFHQLGVRVKRDDGRWSHYWQQSVYISDPNIASVTFPNLIEGEYFFGADPGQGNGTSFIFPDGADITHNFNVSTVGLNPGFHHLGVRVKRDDGRWSHYWQQAVYVSDPNIASVSFPDLIEGEYFFGSDPGQGNGTSFIFPDGADITHNFNISTVGLNPGFHQLGVRVKRDDGRWSHYWQQSVYISDPNIASVTFPDLIEGEYFFGPDPGQGNGISFIFPDGADITHNLNVSTVGLNPGFHQLGIRVKREDGRWSHYWQQSVYIINQSVASTTFDDVVSGEYFFGTDPGQGNGTSFTLTAGANIDETVSISTVGLNPGIHHYGVRVKRADGRWSHFWQRQVEIPTCLLTKTDTIVACGSYTWINNVTYTSSNFVATHLIPQAGCDSLITLHLTIETPSIVPSSIDNLQILCNGGTTDLTVVGGSLGSGDQWQWYAGTCGGSPVGTGSTITVNPNANTEYFVRAEGSTVCAPTSCISIDVNLPTAGTALSLNGESATCYVHHNGWIHFYNASGRLIASVNSNGQNLGNVTAESVVAGSPYQTSACDDSTNPSFFQTNVQRTFVINSSIAPSAPVKLRLYLLDSEIAAYQAQAALNQNSNDNINSIADLNLTKVSGGSGSGNPLDFCSSNGVAEFLIQDLSGDINDPITGFSGFTGTSFLEFTINGFSEFFPMNSDDSPLPVSLTQFNAQCSGDKVNINWSTASESNASHYVLQSSRNGQQWIDLATVEAVGTTNQTSNYSYMDQNFGGLSYYRLIQVDNDGQQEVFGPISSNCQLDNNMMAVHPNPTSESFILTIQSNEHIENTDVQLLDLSGRVVMQQNTDIVYGTTSLNFDVRDVQPGVYTIVVKNENDKFSSLRLVKL